MGFWAGKRVLVTGGGGFLGSHVVEKLRAAGCANPFVARSKQYDLTTEAGADRLFKDMGAVDIVLHLAGLVGGIGANKAQPAEYFYRNLMMGVFTMDRSWKAGAKKFVAAGAGCGYPEHAPLPIKEESYWDGFPQQESAPYSLAKRMLHVQSIAYWRQYKFPAIVTIPGNIYGPYDNFDYEASHVVPALVRKFVEASGGADGRGQHAEKVVCWGSGKPTRDFVYAGDVAEGILRAAEVYSEAALVNISSGKDHSIREVVEALAQITGFGGKIEWDATRPDGQARRLFDISRARRDLGYEPRIGLHEGLRKTVDWFRANVTSHTVRLSA